MTLREKIEAARSGYPLRPWNSIAPNTPAFEEYAVNWMLEQANTVREKWQLEGLSQPLTVDDIYFQLNATIKGIYGGVSTRDLRYSWSFRRNSLDLFYDALYEPRRFKTDQDEAARLGKIPSRITAVEAERIARRALRSLGFNEKQLRLQEPPAVNQYMFEEADGTVYPLPIFNVTWSVKVGWNTFSVRFDISGITTNVARYCHISPYNPSAPLPPNYFEMLGLPANYLDTLSEAERDRLGLPPTPKAIAVWRDLAFRPPPPSTNALDSARISLPGDDLGRIGTNTPVFEEYAVNWMLAQANKVRETWPLDLRRPLTVQDIYFRAKPTPSGIAGTLLSRDGRFRFEFVGNALNGVAQVEGSRPLLSWFTKLTAGEAERLARRAVCAVDLNGYGLRLKEPPTVEEEEAEPLERTTSMTPVPVFLVDWDVEAMRSSEGAWAGGIKALISRRTRKVILLKCDLPAAPLPPRYFEMLGLPANYLHPVRRTAATLASALAAGTIQLNTHN